MADAAKLKRKSLGTPPPANEASGNIYMAEGTSLPERIDGRTLRRTGRTVQFATKVTPELEARIKQIAIRDNLKIVEVLEQAIEAYERNKLAAK